MCTRYYLHRHHAPPCHKHIDFVMQYTYCASATVDMTTGAATPCENIYFDEQQVVDGTNPCAMGGCITSPDCSSGACRLAELNGAWICCQCRGGGNVYRWCSHRMRSSPDTLCYHVCCRNCSADEHGVNMALNTPMTSVGY